MSSDCLVLYIEEDNTYNKNGSSNALFIIYDLLSSHFFLCGNSTSDSNNAHINSNEYSFYCRSDRLDSIVAFVEMNVENNTISLYNYPFLPDKCEDINYDILHYGLRTNNCIANTFLTGSNLVSFLKMLKDVKNDYSLK